MRKPCLGKRLRAAAKFVRQGAVFADVGTDHAYLPIFLLTEGRIKRAVCSDINECPLNTAKQNAALACVEEKIDFVLTDGAEALRHSGITDMAICGMGGELIARIIKDAPFLKNEGIRLILQPMSRQGELRRLLSEEGYSQVAEEYVSDAGKHYVCIVVEYSGDKKELSLVDSEIGMAASTPNSPSKVAYLKSKLQTTIRARDGKLAGGINADEEQKLIDAISGLLESK